MSETKALTTQPDRYDDAEMVRTLKETVCKGANDSQFRMFIEICRATGLNPFLREIWFVPQVGVMAGRDGYLRVANEHPQFDGMETLVERDQAGIPIKATCRVWRKDRAHPITCEAYYNEYKKGSQVWTTYKSAMIAKVAEVLALKRSFSINGVVSEEEIGEQGSREAQKEVAERKIAEMRSGAAVTHIEPGKCLQCGCKPPHHAPGCPLIEMGVTQEDADAILDGVTEEPSKAAEPDKYKALEAFAELKKEIIRLTGSDGYYYAWLGADGYEKSSEVPPAEARKVYKSMAKQLAAWKAAQPPAGEELEPPADHELRVFWPDEDSMRHSFAMVKRAIGKAKYEKVLMDHGIDPAGAVVGRETYLCWRALKRMEEAV